MKKLKLVLLFDIDGTLIKTGGAGLKAMQDTFAEYFNGESRLKDISFAGSTDLGIFYEAVTLAKIPTQKIPDEKQFRRSYLARLNDNLHNLTEGLEILPGVVDFLNACKKNEDIYLGLVTGNYKEGANLKLTHFRLNHYFDQGAFGCDCADRNRLPPIAMKRIEEQGFYLPDRKNIWIIGDTIKDIQCAKKNDLPCLIPFTGFSTRQEILSQNPSMTMETLAEYKTFLKSVLSDINK